MKFKSLILKTTDNTSVLDPTFFLKDIEKTYDIFNDAKDINDLLDKISTIELINNKIVDYSIYEDGFKDQIKIIVTLERPFKRYLPCKPNELYEVLDQIVFSMYKGRRDYGRSWNVIDVVLGKVPCDMKKYYYTKYITSFSNPYKQYVLGWTQEQIDKSNDVKIIFVK